MRDVAASKLSGVFGKVLNLQSIQLCVCETHELFIGSLFGISEYTVRPGGACCQRVHRDQAHVPKSFPDVE